MTTCEECGFVYEDLEARAIAGRLRQLAPAFREALTGTGEAAIRRPTPGVWSALEYTCHVRDVLLVQRDRAILARVEKTPSLARMHRDERVAICRYGDSALAEVLDQLTMAGELCAVVFESFDEAAWSRSLVYNWPATDERDLAWLGRHTVHEGSHHLMDVRRVLTRVLDSR